MYQKSEGLIKWAKRFPVIMNIKAGKSVNKVTIMTINFSFKTRGLEVPVKDFLFLINRMISRKVRIVLITCIKVVTPFDLAVNNKS